MRAVWEQKIKRRMTYTINHVAYNEVRPNWMPEAAWQMLLKRRDDPKFIAKRAKAKANRRSGGKDGKAVGTHTLGQQSAARAFNAMGPEASPHALLVRSKKNKKGEWIHPRAVQIDAEFQKRQSQIDPSLQLSAGDRTAQSYRDYYEAAGGFDRKSRVFGLGLAANDLYTSPGSDSGSSASSQSYTPGLVSRYASLNANLEDKNTQLEERVARLEEDRRRTLAMEALLAQKFGWSFDETCTPGPTPGPKDNFPDDGHAFGSQPPVHPLH